jgi:hypothetical protein
VFRFLFCDPTIKTANKQGTLGGGRREVGEEVLYLSEKTSSTLPANKLGGPKALNTSKNTCPSTMPELLKSVNQRNKAQLIREQKLLNYSFFLVIWIPLTYQTSSLHEFFLLCSS